MTIMARRKTARNEATMVGIALEATPIIELSWKYCRTFKISWACATDWIGIHSQMWRLKPCEFLLLSGAFAAGVSIPTQNFSRVWSVSLEKIVRDAREKKNGEIVQIGEGGEKGRHYERIPNHGLVETVYRDRLIFHWNHRINSQSPQSREGSAERDNLSYCWSSHRCDSWSQGCSPYTFGGVPSEPLH